MCLKDGGKPCETAVRRCASPAAGNLATLTPQAYNEIQYDANHSLWNGTPDRELDVQFFHVGMGFKRRLRMFSVDSESREAREIHFRPELFNYNDAKVDTKQLEGKTDLGFAGFRAFKSRNWPAAISSLSSARATSVRWMKPISTASLRAVSPLTPSAMARRSSRLYGLLVRNPESGRYHICGLHPA